MWNMESYFFLFFLISFLLFLKNSFLNFLMNVELIMLVNFFFLILFNPLNNLKKTFLVFGVMAVISASMGLCILVWKSRSQSSNMNKL